MDNFFLPQLPTEVLEVIFLHLPIRELLQIRLTCHRYRVIVDDCPALRSQFCVKFPIDITLNRSFEPGPMLPATRIIFEKLVISNVSAWWPQVGHRITHLTLRSSKFPLGMLRYTPNLKHLELKDVKLVDRNNNKFKLENLEKLKVSETHAGILDSLEKIVTKPLLKFTFLSEGFCFNRYNANTNIENDVEAQQKIINFISTRQEMLEEINIHPVKYTSEQLLQLRQCKLKKLIIERHNFESKAIYERNLLDFVRAQPTLEKLVMNEPVSVKVSSTIHKNNYSKTNSYFIFTGRKRDQPIASKFEAIICTYHQLRGIQHELVFPNHEQPTDPVPCGGIQTRLRQRLSTSKTQRVHPECNQSEGRQSAKIP